jgi:CubicO group peptidase (beta-lactamase class C family)
VPSTAFPAILLALAAAAQAKPKPVTSESFSACFDAQAKLVPFSGIALADRGDQSFFRRAGYSDPDAKVPISRESRFRLASVQKVITRVAVGLLVQQGKIDFDAPIGRYLADLPPEFAAITVDQLLQHKSGVAPFTNMGKIPQEVRSAYARARNSRERLPIIVGQPLSFLPGQREEYSNGGYQLLGAIIETLSGKDYGAYLDEASFRPLGMTSTDLLPDERTVVRFTKLQPGGGSFPEWTAAVARQERPGNSAGDGVSTADDLTWLGKALLGDKLLSPAVKARLFPRKGEVWRIGQAGGTMGANTDFAAYPETGWVVTVLANYDPPAGELMGEVLRTLVLGKGCTPLSAKDRVSPMQRITAPGPKREVR